MSDARSSSDSHGLRQKLSSLSKGDLIEELIGALMKVTELSARPGSVAQRPIDSGGPVTGEQEPVGWQWHVGENCWTQCDRPSDEELRTKPDKFRPVYLGRMISAPASHDFRNSGESDLSVTPDCAGAGTANLQRWRASLEKALQAERDYWSSIGGVPAQAAPLPDRERMAEILYTAAHKGLRNCWKWSDAELDHEHPTNRGYWYKIADGTLSALSSTDSDIPPGAEHPANYRKAFARPSTDRLTESEKADRAAALAQARAVSSTTSGSAAK